MNFRRLLALPPIEAGLPPLSTDGHGGAAIELPGSESLQHGDPLLPP